MTSSLKVLPTLAKVLLLWGLSVGVIVGGTSSCGDRTLVDETLQDKVRNPNATPTRANFERWKTIWNRKSWIVAWKGKPAAPPPVKDVRNHIVYGILGQVGLSNDMAGFARAYQIVDGSLRVDFTTLTKVLKFAATGQSDISGFANIRIDNDSSVWDQLFSMAGTTSSYAEYGSFAQSTFDTWDALESMSAQLWVEPDLISHTTETLPELDPSTGSDDVIRVFQNMRADKAFAYAEANGLPVAGQERVNVVVGIIDTGVDIEHPKLKDQMFANQLELQGTPGKDDDNNGYIDDIYGFDANYGRNEPDPLPSPVPGPADLGGPGADCPESSGAGSSSACGHGTHVAGLVAAKSTGDGPIGVCQKCKVYSLRAAGRKIVANPEGGHLDVAQGISDSAQIRALAYVLEFYDAETAEKELYLQIVNMSIGKIFRNRSIAFLIRSLQRNGVLVVAAAGNEDTETPSYPGAYNSVLSVCALSVAKTEQESSSGGQSQMGLGEYGKASFSNFGEWVDICAPGSAIYSTWPGTKVPYYTNAGTSMAAPIVAGAAGYLMKLKNDLTATDVQALLKNYANSDDVYKNEPNGYYFQGDFGDTIYYLLGFGALDLENSVKALKGEGVRNEIADSSNFIGVQVPGGCIVSSIGHKANYPFWHFFSSVPFVLGCFWLVLMASRRKQRPKL